MELADLFEWELGLAEEFHDWLRSELAGSRHVRSAFLLGDHDDNLQIVVLHDGETVRVLQALRALVDWAWDRFGIELSFREFSRTEGSGPECWHSRLPR